jgi:branched-chain amino acid transport system substrate-binding protein
MRTAASWLVVAAVVLVPYAARADITIAVVGPMTGPYEQFGEQMRRGAEQAIDDINTGGGILGSDLALKVEDDRCDPRLAVAIANFLPGDEVHFVAGHFCSVASIPASKIYDEEGIIQISPAPGDPRLTDEGGDHIFRLAGREDRQAELAAQVLAHYFANRPIAILSNGGAYGNGLALHLKQILNERGIQEAVFEVYDPAETDHSALITELQAAGIAAIYIGGNYAEAGLIISQAHRQEFRPQLIGSDSLAAEEFWPLAGTAAQGTLVTYPLDPRTLADAAPIIARFRAQRFEPEGVTLYTYAAIQVYAQAVVSAGTLEPEAVSRAMHRDSFSTVLGDIIFDQNGDMNLPGYVWHRWSEGQLSQPQ